ncbi:hypothetical protein ACIP1X_00740 [Pseudomonas sp. NPDC088885]|jgi:hypothetical protein|uniref:hypothetical protein n=1 Tax=Pseudomonas sp. NPDC088885 TaxID=3364457 RepID=UPI00382E68E9
MPQEMVLMGARLLAALLFVMLAGCSGDEDFAYNEHVMTQYLAHRAKVDDVQQSVESGEFTFDYYSLKYRKMQRLSDAAREAMAGIDNIPRSAHARGFSQALVHYYETEAAYYLWVKRYIQKRGNFDGVKLLTKINASYNELSELSHEVQVSQLEFLKSAGIHTSG